MVCHAPQYLLIVKAESATILGTKPKRGRHIGIRIVQHFVFIQTARIICMDSLNVVAGAFDWPSSGTASEHTEVASSHTCDLGRIQKRFTCRAPIRVHSWKQPVRANCMWVTEEDDGLSADAFLPHELHICSEPKVIARWTWDTQWWWVWLGIKMPWGRFFFQKATVSICNKLLNPNLFALSLSLPTSGGLSVQPCGSTKM